MWRNEQGSVLIETALVFPMIIGLMMGLIFFMVTYRELVTMGIATKESSRTLAVTQGNIEYTQRKIQDELNIGLMDTPQVQIEIKPEENRVVVTRPIGFYIPMLEQYLIRLQVSQEFFEERLPRYYNQPW